MARAKRGKNGRFLKKRKVSSKKRKNPSRKKRTYRKRKVSSKKRKNPIARKRRNTSHKRRTYRKRRNPMPMKVAGLDVKEIAVFTGALIGVEYANQQLFGPKYRHGWMGGLVKLATALGLAFALKKTKLCGAATCKAIQLAGVTHAAVAIANEAMVRVPSALKLSKPLLGERQYRLLGERQYKALGNRPAHLSGGKRARYGSSLPRHLVSRAGK
jgi:hypothetical protein